MNSGKEKAALLLKTARGQIDGILRMLEEDRYCIDISNQLLATRAVLDKANGHILRGHMDNCLRRAFETQDEQSQQHMLDELMQVLGKL